MSLGTFAGAISEIPGISGRLKILGGDIMPKNGRTRASNGMGSVRQRTDGRWEARYTSPTGTQRSIYGKTEAEVTKKLRGVLHDMDSGSWREPSKMTVQQWLEVWINDYQSHVIQRTQDFYSQMIRLHINPVIGTVKMKSLSPIHVRRVISVMTDKKLSANYIEHCQTIMSSAFKCAVEAGIIMSNPAHGIKTPRTPRRRLTIVDRDNIPKFIEAAMENADYGYAMVFLLLTGLRVSEERGLQWSDFDEDKATLRVERQLYPKVKGEPFSPPKDESRRTIELPQEAVDLLRNVRKAQEAAKIAAGDKWVDTDITRNLIFRTHKGKYINKTTMATALHQVGVKIGLPDLHPHDLRHSYAVAALRSGIDVKTVQNNLGHKNAYMTLDVYAAYTEDAGRTGAKKFSNYWHDAVTQKGGENEESKPV